MDRTRGIETYVVIRDRKIFPKPLEEEQLQVRVSCSTPY